MISAKILQNQYIKLYEILRKYVWDINVVEQIVDLECEVYQAFPDISKVKLNLDKLKQSTCSTLYNDEELVESFEDFTEVLNSDDTICLFVKTFKGVKPHED